MSLVNKEEEYFSILSRRLCVIFKELKKSVDCLKKREDYINFLVEKILTRKYSFPILVLFKDIVPELLQKCKKFPHNYEQFLSVLSVHLKYNEPIVIREFLRAFRDGPIIKDTNFLRNVASYNEEILKDKNLSEIFLCEEIPLTIKFSILSHFYRKDIGIREYNKEIESIHRNKIKKFNVGDLINQNNTVVELSEYVRIDENWIPKKNKPLTRQMVWTESFKKKMNEISLFISNNEPVVLVGSSGSGKTSIVNELSRVTGNNDMIKIHVDENLSSKDLIGMYVCSDNPGEFKWIDGTLTKSVKQGRWLLIEDLDLASEDIVVQITSLIENKKLFFKNQEIKVHPNFRIFATVYETQRKGRVNLDKWNIVKMETLSENETREVLKKKYPNINETVQEKIFLTYLEIGGKNIRKLLKWVDRIELLYNSEQFRDSAFLEFRNVFCLDPNNQKHLEILRKLAIIWSITTDRLFYLMNNHKPTFQNFSHKDLIKIGNVTFLVDKKNEPPHNFAFTKQSLRILENLAIGIKLNEPILLTGETGTGKTTIVQYLSKILNKKLFVQNLNQQTDSSDFIGNFKPVDLHVLASSLFDKFLKLFKASYSKVENKVFITSLKFKLKNKEYKEMVSRMKLVCSKSISVFSSKSRKIGTKEGKLYDYWEKMEEKIEKFEEMVKVLSKNFAFNFVEGNLIKAIRNGHWVLLDEINLASNETLERLSGLLEKDGSLFITEKGDTELVKRHKDFRLFACMNPPTDVGKKDLPIGIKNKFTQIIIQELIDREDLMVLVNSYLGRFVSNVPSDEIVNFYLKARKMCDDAEIDSGNNNSPKYTLRTLSRSLMYTLNVLDFYHNFEKALYEGISMSFLTQLDPPSKKLMKKVIKEQFKYNKNYSKKASPNNYLKIKDFYLLKGTENIESIDNDFVLTKTIQKRVKELARVLMNPNNISVLLEGPTSAGKTSIIRYMAGITKHKFVRINNHETTDIQEYFGTYITTKEGKFVFKKGALVDAVENGYWIVLDELNLASTEILESLNRLLDDNRELFIPETQEIIKPHPNFKLFATQNPSGSYSGRKVLSRAFKNRFVELQFSEIPLEEVKEILQKKYQIPGTIAQKFIKVMKELQMMRKTSNVFAGKRGYITPRDVFKWANRCSKNFDYAEQGYVTLGERIRNESEKKIIRRAIEKHFRFNNNLEYKITNFETIKKKLSENEKFKHIVWTETLQRLYYLIEQCIKFREPTLLIGETGCGKTTIIEMFSFLLDIDLTIINCHQNSETSDFIGSLRPLRAKSEIKNKLELIIQKYSEDFDVKMRDKSEKIIGEQDSIISKIENIMEKIEDETEKEEIKKLLVEYKTLFKWYDGPLVKTMKKGDFFLIDEINLTDDAVIERMNSVLEIDSRDILLSEKGGEEVEKVQAEENFRVFATMNPSGDFGKKELSYSLRNRFTEIYVPKLKLSDMRLIIEKRLKPKQFIEPMVEFISKTVGELNFSIRDVIFWIEFINLDSDNFPVDLRYIHGCDMIILEGIGIGRSNSLQRDEKKKFIEILFSSFPNETNIKRNLWNDFITNSQLTFKENIFGCFPFFIDVSTVNYSLKELKYTLNNTTTKKNLLKVLRGLQMKNRPILLEGSPGVGKTSLINVLGKITGHDVVRINLSEQTDIIDLIGCDLPKEDGSFQWCNGIFLDGLQKGSWIILDELNLASQSVLEGLNSVLDYRKEIYVPELNKTFKCSDKFKIFSCQNPYKEGSSRKGLPKSFLNRFVKVYVEEMIVEDYICIIKEIYPNLEEEKYLEKLIIFNDLIRKEFKDKWEFNLRDIFRWCEMRKTFPNEEKEKIFETIYLQRLRSEDERNFVVLTYEQVFGEKLRKKGNASFVIKENFVKFGNVVLETKNTSESLTCEKGLVMLHSFLSPLETILRCIKSNELCIIVGKSNSGKTSLLNVIASLLKKKVRVFPVTPSTDTMDLLGNFEQISIIDKKMKVIIQIEKLMERILHESLINLSIKLDEAFFVDYQQIRKSKENEDFPIETIEQIIKRFSYYAKKEELKKLNRRISKIKHLKKTGTKGKFGWTNSSLINSMKNGDWVIMDNVNLCNPTVLDRLNSLFEPNGKIVLNERGLLKNGKFKEIIPHPDFRMFMVYNYELGEISRAMKNRGVEMHVEIKNKEDYKRIFLSKGLFNLKIIEKKLDIDFSNSIQSLGRSIQKRIEINRDYLSGTETKKYSEINFPNSHFLLNAFKIDLIKDYCSILRDFAFLEEDYRTKKDNKNSLIYFLIHSTPKDIKQRLEMIIEKKEKENSIFFKAFLKFWDNSFIKSIVSERIKNKYLSSFPLDMRVLHNGKKEAKTFYKENQIIEMKSIDRILKIEKDKLKIKVLLEKTDLIRFFNFENEEKNKVDFKIFISNCMKILEKQIIEGKELPHFGSALRSNRKLLKYLQENKKITPLFIVFWKQFEKYWKGITDVKDVERMIAKLYPNFKSKNIFSKLYGKGLEIDDSILTENQDSKLLEEIKKVQITLPKYLQNANFKELLLQFYFALYSYSVVQNPNHSILKKAKKETWDCVNKWEKKALNIIEQSQLIGSSNEMDKLNSLFLNKGILVLNSFLQKRNFNFDLLKNDAQFFLNFLIKYSGIELENFVPMKFISEFSTINEDLRNKIFFQMEQNIYGIISKQTSIYFEDEKKFELDVIFEKLLQDISLREKETKIRESQSLLNFLKDTNKSNFETNFAKDEYENLKTLFERTCHNLNIKKLEDVETKVKTREYVDLFHDLFNFFSSSQKNILEISLKRLHLSIVRVNLAKPVSPVDPIIKARIYKDNLTKELNNLIERKKVFEEIELYKKGSTQSFSIEKIDNRIKKIESKIEKVNIKMGSFSETLHERKTNEKYYQLYKTINECTEQFFDYKRLETIFKVESSEVIIQNKIDNWRWNVESYLTRISKFSNVYKDVVYPFINIVNEIFYSITLLLMIVRIRTEKKKEKYGREELVESLMCFNLVDTIESIELLRENEELSKENIGVLLSMMKVKLLKMKLKRPFDKEDFTKNLNRYLLILAKLSDMQTKQKIEDERVFKKNKTTTVIKSDEELIDEELDTFFPNFNFEYKKFLTEEESKNVLTNEMLKDVNIEKEQEFITNMIIQMEHENLMRNEIVKLVGKESLKIIEDIKNQHKENFRFDNCFKKDLLLFNLSLQNFELSKDTTINDNITQKNVFAMNEIFDLIKKILKKVYSINKDQGSIFFGENNSKDWHPLLKEIKDLCLQIISYSVFSPMNKMLVGLEILFDKLTKWKEFKVETTEKDSPDTSRNDFQLYIQDVSRIVLKWRKVELKNLSTLFLKKKQNYCHKTDIMFWDIISKFLQVEIPENNTKESKDTLKKILSEILKILEKFILSSTFGNIGHRLKMLKIVPEIFKAKIHKKSFSLIFNLVSNCIEFYSQFCEKIQNQMKEMKCPLEKQISDFIKINRWESFNINSIRKNLQISRRKLGKILLSYEESILRRNFLKFTMDEYYNEDKIKKVGSFKREKISFDRSNKKLEKVIKQTFENKRFEEFRREVVSGTNETMDGFNDLKNKMEKQKNLNIKKRMIIEMTKSLSAYVKDSKKERDSENIKINTSVNSIFLRELENSELLNRNLFILQKLSNLLMTENQNLRCTKTFQAQLAKFRSFHTNLLSFVLFQNNLMVKISKDVDELIFLRSVFVEGLNCSKNGENYAVVEYGEVKDLIDEQNFLVSCVNFHTEKIAAIESEKNKKSLNFLQVFDVKEKKEKIETKDKIVFNIDTFKTKNSDIKKKISEFQLTYLMGKFEEFNKICEEKIETMKTIEKDINSEIVKEKVMLMIQTMNEAMERGEKKEPEIVVKYNDVFEDLIINSRIDLVIKSVKESMKCSSKFYQIRKNGEEIIDLIHTVLNCTKICEGYLRKNYECLNCLLNNSLLNFFTLVKNDFYMDDDDEGEMEKGETNFEEGGSGFDDGEGTVGADTSQIENEEQILKNEDMFQNKNEPKNDEDNDNYLEPETNFFSDLMDIDEKEEEQEEGEEEDQEKEMGDIEDDERKIDKQLWGDEEKEDLDEKELDKQTEKTGSEEMRASEEEEKKNPQNEKEVKEQEEDPSKQEVPKHDEKEIEYENEDRMDVDDEIEQDEFVDEYPGENEEKNEESGENDDDKMNMDEDENDEEEKEEIDINTNMDEMLKEEEENDDGKQTLDQINQPELEEVGEDDNPIDTEKGIEEEEEEQDVQMEDKEIDPSHQDENETEDLTKNLNDENKREQYENDLEATPYGVNMSGGDGVMQEEEKEEIDLMQQNEGGEKDSGIDVNKEMMGDSKVENFKETERIEKNETETNTLTIDPLRKLAESLTEFQEQLNVVDDEEDESTKEDEKEGKDFEFVKNDEETEVTDLTMAPTEEQVNGEMNEKMEDLDSEKKEEKKKDKKEQNEENIELREGNSERDSIKEIKEVDEDVQMEDKKKILTDDDMDFDNDKDEIFSFNFDNDFKFENVSKQNYSFEKGEIENLEIIDEVKEEYKRIVKKTKRHSQNLCEQLRLILAPTEINKLSGDYKTGKRLNLKRIIPYIASEFRKDKIWLRRTKPNKRDYRISISIDDSLSMKSVSKYALEAMVLICKSLTQLEVGKISVFSFGEKTKVLLDYNDVYTDEVGTKLLSQFDFTQGQTKVYDLLNVLSQKIDSETRNTRSSVDQYNISFIISDGQISEYQKCKKIIQKIHAQRSVVVFVVIDKKSEPILEKRIVEFEKNGEVNVVSVLEKFPFPYYLIVRKIDNLPQTLSNALRQFFQSIEKGEM